MAAPTRWLSRRAREVPKNPFACLIPLMGNPDNFTLCQGVPPAFTFPMSSLDITLSNRSNPSLPQTVLHIDQQDTMNAQRYPPFAWGKLKSFLISHMEAIHGLTTQDKFPKGQGWDVAIAAGSMSSVDIVMEMFLDQGSNDVILLEEYSFTATLDALKARGTQMAKVRVDSQGLDPVHLSQVCQSLVSVGKLPKILYTIPVGQNPTGTRLSKDRYAEVYEVCRRFDLLIVEDDSYFYQQHNAHKPDQCVPGLSQLGPSFVGSDPDRRVMRLDSFSKLLAPGFRIAWVTGPTELTVKYNEMAYSSSQNGSSLSMVVLTALLENWGWDGLNTHVTFLQNALRERCLALIAAIDYHLSDLVEYQVPQAGMFLWLRLKHISALDPITLVARMQQHGVIVFAGEHCSVDHSHNPHLRITYVLDAPAYMPAMARLRELILGIVEDSKTESVANGTTNVV
eukprot:c3514_g1_i1.p1 GENE.c3514_g1_i1~~c3514_g1_i1.p1  ORF type:complete len:453 (+),score=92.67 c3514_g1_i1:86-1444(+)